MRWDAVELLSFRRAAPALALFALAFGLWYAVAAVA
jgi:hypothetical protein